MKLVIPQGVKINRALRWGDGEIVDETKNINYLREHSIWVNLDPGVIVIHGSTEPIDRYNGDDKPYLIAWAPPGMSTRKRKGIAAKIIGGDSTASLPVTSDRRSHFVEDYKRKPALLPPLAWASCLTLENDNSADEIKAVVDFWSAVQESSGDYTIKSPEKELVEDSFNPGSVQRAALRILYKLRETVTSMTELRNAVEFNNEDIVADQIVQGSIASLTNRGYYGSSCEVVPAVEWPRSEIEDNLFKVKNLPETREIGHRFLTLLKEWEYDVHWSLLGKRVEAHAATLIWDKQGQGYRKKVQREGRRQVEAFRNLSLSRYMEITEFQVAKAAFFVSSLIPGYDNSEEFRRCLELIPKPEVLLKNRDHLHAGSFPEDDHEYLKEVGSGTYISEVGRLIDAMLTVLSPGEVRNALLRVKKLRKDNEWEAKKSAWVHQFRETHRRDRKLSLLDNDPLSRSTEFLGDSILQEVSKEHPGILAEAAQFLSMNIEVDGCRRSAGILSRSPYLMEHLED